MGWAYLVLPYADNRVMPLLLLGGLFVVLTAIGYALLYRRDVGSSLFASRPGRARASALLSGTWGLAARLQWSNLLAWGAGFVVSGILIAVVVNDYQQTFQENEIFRQLLASTGSTTASFLELIIALMYPLMATFLAGYAVAALIKLSDEETSGRLEALLATATDRTRWLWSHVGSTMIGSVLLFAAMGVTGALGFAAVSGTTEVDPSMIWWASLIIVPAMLVFISGIALVYALWGRWVKPFAWTWYAYCAFIGSFAGIFSWPDWVTKLSPFDYTPAYPSDTVEWSILAALVAVAVVMSLVATVIFRQRDITTE